VPYPSPTTYPGPDLFPGIFSSEEGGGGREDVGSWPPLALRWLRYLPPAIQEVYEVRAVIYALAKEAILADARMTWLIEQIFPQLANHEGLSIAEATLGITMAPEGVDLEERREIVMTYLRSFRSSGSGASWERAVTELIGAGWDYFEHDVDDPTAADPNTVEIRLPFAPDSDRYAQVQRLLRAITGVGIELSFDTEGGFILDTSDLDVEQMR